MAEFDWSRIEEASAEFEKARKVDYRLRQAGFTVTCNARSDRKWQCAIEKGMVRGKGGILATAIEDTWEASIISANENLARGVSGPSLELL